MAVLRILPSAARPTVVAEQVPRPAAADVVDGSDLGVDDALALELLVEGEDGALGGAVDVAGAAAARGEGAPCVVGGGQRGERGRARGGGGGRDGRGVDVLEVAGAAAAGVDVACAGDGGVRFCEVEGGFHFGRGVVGVGGYGLWVCSMSVGVLWSCWVLCYSMYEECQI